jgi:2',3'-cyclic-nucleotide 2'-phosphodiesterase / 3'-nucleotidase
MHNGTTFILGFVAAVGTTAAVEAADVQLRILETTDIHVHVVDYDYYQDQQSDAVGLARTARLIEAARAEVANSILIDNGDLIQGNPLGDYMAHERGLADGDVHPVYKAMNLLGYDVGNYGNHEFNYGLDYLAEAVDDAAFPYVNANIVHLGGDGDPANDRPYFTPYVLLDRTVTDTGGVEHPIRIGVIGFVPPQIMQWDKTNLEGTVETRDIVATAEHYVPQMRAERADIVIAVPHSGLTVMGPDGMDENATYWLSQVEGIDAILFGHAHQVFPGDTYADVEGADIVNGTLNGVPAVMPGFWGSHLGVIDLQLSVDDAGAWSVAGGTGAVRGIFERDGRDVIPLVDADPKIVEAVREEHEATIAYMRQPVGQTSAPITSYFALVQDDPSIQIVTNAQKWYVEQLIAGSDLSGVPVLSAGAPFKAGGRGGPEYFTDIPAGEIALMNVADLYIYPNTLQAVLLNGEQVQNWLEMSAGAFNRIDPAVSEPQPLLNPDFPSYNFDVIDGVEYQIDLTQPARFASDGTLANPDANRITGLSFQGEPIDPEDQFIVATNNYRASGGGSFPGLDGSNTVIEAPDENRTILGNYILQLGTIDPSADGNWSFKPIPGDVTVTFPSAPDAESAITPEMGIVRVGEDEAGFGVYEIELN